jgi:glyoxalase family protein
MESATLGIHNMGLVTGDAGRAERFYTEALGMHRVGRDGPGEGDGERLLIGDAAGAPGTLLNLTVNSGSGPGRPGSGGVHHVAFGVADEDGLLRWKRWLEDLGTPVSGPYDRGYFTSIYFRDPDGQILEIATAGPGYEIDEARASLGRELRLPPERIVRGHRDEAAIARLTWPEPVTGIDDGMRLNGIHHVSGITGDLDRAGEFLEAVLGLSLVKRTTNRDAPDMLHYFWARVTEDGVAHGSAYTLFGWPAGWHDARDGIGQAEWIAFRARDAEHLGMFGDRLRGLDVKVGEVVGPTGTRGLRFRAPDGQRMEIVVDEATS